MIQDNFQISNEKFEYLEERLRILREEDFQEYLQTRVNPIIAVNVTLLEDQRNLSYILSISSFFKNFFK